MSEVIVTPAAAPTAAPAAAPLGGPGAAPRRTSRGLVVGSIALVGVAVGAVTLIAARRNSSVHHEATVRTEDAARGTEVRAVSVAMSPAVHHLALIGEARPYAEVTLYAKVSGYLQTVRVDRGDHVRTGQVLAAVQSPETDRALAGARADYEQKAVTSNRMAQLYAQQFVSSQETDQARADAEVSRQRVAALNEERAYETLRAPFDGTVTARYADPGALMQNAAASQTAALPVVTVSQTDRLRVFVYLDQGDAASVRPGMDAVITEDDRAGVRVPAHVSRLSGALDPRTRKMLAEIDVDNRGNRIVPGAFVQVTLDLPATRRPEAPVNALVVRGDSSYVARVDSTGNSARLQFVPVTVAGNDGKVVTFSSGVTPGERVALNAATLADGARVRLAPDSTALAARGGTP